MDNPRDERVEREKSYTSRRRLIRSGSGHHRWRRPPLCSPASNGDSCPPDSTPRRLKTSADPILTVSRGMNPWRCGRTSARNRLVKCGSGLSSERPFRRSPLPLRGDCRAAPDTREAGDRRRRHVPASRVDAPAVALEWPSHVRVACRCERQTHPRPSGMTRADAPANRRGRD